MRLLALLVLLLAGPAYAADDPLELLWGHRLHLAPDGSPLSTVRIDEGEEELVLSAEGATVAARGRTIARGGTFRFRVRGGVPAKLRHAVQVAELPFDERAAAERELDAWRGRGYPARAVAIGGVYGLSGRVLDNRRYAILLSAPGARADAEALASLVRARHPDAEPSLFEELEARPSGEVEVLDASGRSLGRAEGAVVVEARGAITVRRVEHDIGYARHGREDRSYRGAVYVTVGADGRVAAVSVLPLEQHVRGVVPAEIFANAPDAALRAQAVTARGEVLAKIGVRHRGDPYLLCAEQHCQVYKGISGEHANTDRAIAATHGEVLLDARGRLVDSVYSSTCGGHTENNEAVWGTPPDPNLRGVPDWLGGPEELARFEERVGDVEAFLAAGVPGMCGVASFARPEKYRWERRFTAAELDAIGARLGVGRVLSLEPTGRGVSGRATGLAFTGDEGAAVVRGELAVRRLLGNLESTLFVIEREGPADRPTGWRFRGAGWGHGVGMCQTGAIGRAERGHTHREILGHYYGGAQPVRLYAPAEAGR